MIVHGYDADQRRPGSRGEALKKELIVALPELGIAEKRLKLKGEAKGLRL
jgi:hypothetical protein